MRHRLVILLILAALSAVFLPSSATADAHRDKAVALLQQTGTLDRIPLYADLLWSQRLQELQQSNPKLSDAALAKERLRVNALFKANIPALVDQLVSSYANNLSDQEMDALIAFYKTPVGHGVLTKLPLISRDSVAIIKTWSSNLQTKIAADGSKN